MFKLQVKYANLKIGLTEIGNSNSSVMNYENIVKSIREGEFLCPIEPLADDIQTTSPTLKMKALEFIQKDKVFLNPKGRFFTINSGDNFYTVTFSPKPKCTCPASNLCSHLIAASISIGIDASDDIFTDPAKFINLSKLRKNARGNKKKPGRKQPRVGDYKVIPAEDSLQNKEKEDDEEPKEETYVADDKDEPEENDEPSKKKSRSSRQKATDVCSCFS